MGSQYGPYIMYFLSQLLQKQRMGQTNASEADETEARDTQKETVTEAEARDTQKETVTEAEARRQPGTHPAADIFDQDETGACWHRQTQIALLEKFCPEGEAQARKHGHFLIGQNGQDSFVGIPGRFLRAEQPAGGKTGFTLWQPIRGGAELYEELAELDDTMAEYLYGYWIARVDAKTLALSEV